MPLPQQSQVEPVDAAGLMTVGPRTCSPFSSVMEVALVFRDADCGAVPVTEDGKAVGIVTDRDVALAAASYPDLTTRPIGEIMTKGVVTVKAGGDAGGDEGAVRRGAGPAAGRGR